MSIEIECETAQRTLKTTKRLKDARYIVRRPSLSLNEDHHRGKMDMLSMYKEMDKLVTVVVVCISFVTRDKEANWMHRSVPERRSQINDYTHGRIWNCPWEPLLLPPQR